MPRSPSRSLPKALVAGVVAAAILAATPTALAQLAFVERPLYEAGADFPYFLASGDLDGDGDIDLVIASEYGLSWHENSGGAQPTFSKHEIPTPANSEQWCAVADLDDDGDLDILDSEGSPTALFWYENSGSQPPSFIRHQLYTLVARIGSVAAVDLDADGDTDILQIESGGQLGWLESDGGSPPTFTSHSITSVFISSLYSFGFADLDGDGDLDAFANDHHGETFWWQSTGDSPPSFTQRSLGTTTSEGPIIRAGDFDGDGDIDLLQAGYYSLVLFVNDGAPVPTLTQRVIEPDFSGFLLNIADLNVDGALDFIALRDSLTWNENDGNPLPSFTRYAFGRDGGNSRLNGITADLDGDSDLDIVVARTDEHSVVWFENADVLNLNQGQEYSHLQPAIEDATSGDTLLAYPEHFRSDMLPTMDCAGKAINVRSRGALVRPGATETILAGGSSLRAEEGETLVVEGSLTVPGGAIVELSGRTVTIAGDLFVGDSAGLLAGDSLSVKGLATFAPRSISIQDTVRLAGTCVTDIDGDGDLDALVAAIDEVWVCESDGADPPLFVTRQIGTVPVSPSNSAEEVRFLHAADLDGDSDMDVVSSAVINGETWWWENDGNRPAAFTRHTLVQNTQIYRSLFSVDLDADGDLDLMPYSGILSPKWFENSGSSPPLFVVRSISAVGAFPYPHPRIVFSAPDFDGDGDVDLLATDILSQTLHWYESDGASPPGFTLHILAGRKGVSSATAIDFDLDGDMDVLASFQYPRTVAWYENAGGAAPSFVEHVIVAYPPNDQLGQFELIRPADIDLDGDIDFVLEAQFGVRSLAWFESNGALVPSFAEHWITDLSEILVSLEITDINGDGIVDVVPSGSGTGITPWLENTLVEQLHLTGGADVACEADVAVINRAIEVQSASVLSANGTISFDRTSTLRGDGVVSAEAVRCAGLVEPTPASTLSIDGDYVQSFDDGAVGLRTGVLSINLGDGTSPAMLAVTGDAELAGSLRVSASPAFAPSVGSAFEVLGARSLAPGSRFSTALLPSIGSDRFLAVVYRERPPLTSESRPHDFEIVDETPPESADAGLIAAASVALVVNSLTGDVELDPQAGADSGSAGVPKGATLADIDGDGDPDLLIALPDATNPTTAPGSVVILYNADDGNPANGWEGFSDTLQITTGVGVNPSSVAVGRIDGDAIPDIVVSNRGTPGSAGNDSVSVLLVSNPSALTFSLSASFAVTVGDEPADVIVADLDGDGILDIATANAASNSISVGWNDSVATGPAWMPVTVQPAPLPDDDEVPLSIRPGDTNAGIFKFIATSNSGSNTIGLVQINPNRSTMVMPSVPAGSAPVEIVVADFNLDGNDDIAAVNRNSSSVTIVLNQTGAGPTLAMGLPSNLPIPTTTSKPRSIAAGDFDADANGDIDLAILADGVVKILRNDLFNGQLAFTPIPDQPAGASPLLVRSGDLNVDGRDDVVTIAQSTGLLLRGAATRSADSVSILLAASQAPACVGDITGDGLTNSADFNVLASNFGATVTPNTNGDLTGDGIVNSADFNILAGDFGCGS